MRLLAAFGLLAAFTPLTAFGSLALAAPAAGQHPAARPAGYAEGPSQALAQVRVTARIVVVDREAFTRAGLSYVMVGNDRVRVSQTGRGGARGARVAVGTHGVTAFLEAVRESRWIRSESTQQVLTIAGGEALVSSTELAVSRHGSRTRGPVLSVIPSVLADGSVHLRVSTRLEDAVSYGWGYTVDGSPAAVDTEVITGDGEEVILASSAAVQSTRESGLLSWGGGEQGRDVLISVRAQVVPRRP